VFVIAFREDIVALNIIDRGIYNCGLRLRSYNAALYLTIYMTHRDDELFEFLIFLINHVSYQLLIFSKFLVTICFE